VQHRNRVAGSAAVGPVPSMLRERLWSSYGTLSAV
jgi:hypothetical protein